MSQRIGTTAGASVSSRQSEEQELAVSAFKFALDHSDTLTGFNRGRTGDGANNTVGIGFFITAT